MAEAAAAILTALQLLGQALATEIVKEAHSHASEISSTFSNLELRMKKIKSELQVMQSFLDQMETYDQSNKAMMTWLGEVQMVADAIKGIVDEFKHLVGTKKFGGKRFFFKSLFKEPTALVALKKIAELLACEEDRLEHLGKTKERWVTVTRAEVGSSTNDVNQRPVREAVYSYSTDELDLVGIDENKEKLTNLINSKESHLSLISVWGMGGIGKTTLVTSVFNGEREHFSCNAQICISQNYKAEQVLRNLICEICNSEQRNKIKTDHMELRGLKETLRGLLRQRKYLIVLDDAWDQNSYQGIRDVFADSNQGSRIIITTRNADVACLAKESNRLELKPLPVGESWKIFSRIAF
ncbi:Disease resistance protein RPM1 [Rhynchospora pubera]|uniref:Disease resistance protein RPM1 n=1 Tax=Rhynchospora pubera TaxID=906938 RepID=A0AAV8BPX5_9POAL|nr:Disease resistance protein RPM1 [Rhynchospora pubera]